MAERLNISVLLVDDHQMVRASLRRLLNKHPDIEVVGEAEDGLQALRLAGELLPDVMVLDVVMPRMGGFEVLRKLGDWARAPAVVMCSLHDHVLPGARTLGAKALVDKRAAATTLVQAVRKASRTTDSIST